MLPNKRRPIMLLLFEPGCQQMKVGIKAMRNEKNSVTQGVLQVFAFLFWCAAGAAAEPAGSPLSSTNIFAPASTPAKTIFGLSVFVLILTGIIFVVVGGLLVYSVVKFRGKAADSGREPAQVYGSTQIELAWTVIPVLMRTRCDTACSVESQAIY
jgi:heme/copper-type cytochrome/quinol oxidase subunit 2